MEDKVVERGRQGPQAVEFLARLDENVFRDAETAQAPVRPSHALNGWLVAFRHDDEKVQVAAFIRSSPGVGAEEPDALRMEFVRQPMGNFVQQTLVDYSHGMQGNMTSAFMGRAQ